MEELRRNSAHCSRWLWVEVSHQIQILVGGGIPELVWMQWKGVKSVLLLKTELWLYRPQPFTMVTALIGHNSNSGPHIQLNH